MAGNTWNGDETEDELALALLLPRRNIRLLFDLRPLRPLLRAIPEEKLTPQQVNLAYRANSYDALICYKNVTPRKTE